MTEIRTIWKVLTFRATLEDLQRSGLRLMAVGLLITWIVGIGRWWDDPRVLPAFVRAGLGSVIYVFALSALLWFLSAPLLRGRLPSYFVFASFVAACSLPGLVYAVPIERMSGMEAASSYNLVALGFVSIYRLSLLWWFYARVLGLGGSRAIVMTFLPVSAIALSLTMLGHGARVIDIMGGLRDSMSKTQMETAVSTIGCLSFALGPILLIAYLVQVGWSFHTREEPE